jgi:anti-anti-sigma factor
LSAAENDELTIKTEVSDLGVTVIATGTVDFSTHDILRQHLTELIRAGHQDIRVDLSAVRYVDSTGLTVFLRAWSTMRQRSARFAVIHPSSQVARIFSLLKLDFLIGSTAA